MMRGGRTAQAQQRLATAEELERQRLAPQLSLAERERMVAEGRKMMDQLRNSPLTQKMFSGMNGVNNNPPPQKMGGGLGSLSPKQLRGLLQGNPAQKLGTSPVPTNLPKMSGPLGRVASPQPPQQAPRRGGVFGGTQTRPIPSAPAPVPAKSGLGSILAGEGRSIANRNPGINTTTTADMTRKSNAKPFSSVAGSLGMGLAKKMGMKKGGAVKKMASGGKVSSASKRGDGCAVKGKTKGRIV